jgi:hypothetical protein
MNNFVTSYYLYRYYNDPGGKKNLILEPLSTVLKVSLLKYKPTGTKISISDNAISYNSPSTMQGFLRNWRGDNREDLHNICNPLTQALRWYPKEEPLYAFLYELCVQGLRKLKEVYEDNSTIHHTIQHYIGLIEDDSETDDSKNPIIEELHDIWTESEIKVVYDLLRLCETLTDDTERDIYLKSLTDIVESKEKKVYSYIQRTTTQY